MKNWLFLVLIFTSAASLHAQKDTTSFPFKKHSVQSQHLQQPRDFWVSLPMRYSDTTHHPVIYVLDAEWRFDLIRNMAWDLEGNRKIPSYIIVGIPHVDWEYTRGQDLTFSESRMEYDGEPVDSTWYNSTNSGKAQDFYNYLIQEVIPTVNSQYRTNNNNVLVGHSYGGYFGTYILSMNHPFTAIQAYDPSIWYSDGEVIKILKNKIPKKESVSVFISYQDEPKFHKDKIEELISLLKNQSAIKLRTKRYSEETHNSLYMYSFLEGILTVD